MKGFETRLQQSASGDHQEPATVTCSHATLQQMHKLVMIVVKMSKRKPLPPQIAKLNAFILQQVSFRDLADHLHASGVTDPNDFEWKCRLKYRHLKSGTAKSQETQVGISAGGDWNISYAFEYYAENARIVVTPTAERCWFGYSMRCANGAAEWCRVLAGVPI